MTLRPTQAIMSALEVRHEDPLLARSSCRAGNLEVRAAGPETSGCSHKVFARCIMSAGCFPSTSPPIPTTMPLHLKSAQTKWTARL